MSLIWMATEYQNALQGTDFFSSWDKDGDGFLDEYELADGVFNKWDIDQNGYIEKEEFTDFEVYYLDV